ncbi:DUF1186 domain-containing protein [Mesonia mobilis]|uniref:DUF1186 domain-containing protein n=1 Tax=Mesonia mobilis TaxID=369791 RepID=UPI0024BB295A|nr:DUF1186 domain-containing protein [Mesonia mobilis]
MKDLNHPLQSYRLSNDPKLLDKENHISFEVRKILEGIQPDVLKGKSYLLKKLPRLIKQNPRVPVFKNLLATVHKERGEIEQAFKANRWLVKEHPNYLFGRLNLAVEYLDTAPEKIPGILGESMELQALYPNRKEFHIEEFIAFNQIAALYFLAINDLRQAEIRLEMMQSISPEHPKTNYLQERIQQFKLTDHSENQKIMQAHQAPKFNFPLQMQWLYEEDHDFPKNKIATILRLDRKPLIEDLKKVLQDSIIRFNYFIEEEDEIDFLLFPIHAIFFLEELEAEKALPEILEVLSQNEEYYEIIFGDFINEIVNSIVYSFGEHHLDQFFNFLKQPSIYTFSKSYISEAMLLLLKEKPNLREKVQAHYKSLLETFIEKKDDKTLVDQLAYGLIVSDIVELRMNALYPEIKKLYQLRLVDEDVCGTIEEVKKDIFSDPDQIQKDYSLPTASIYGKYEIWKKNYEDFLENEFKELEDEFGDNLFDDFEEDEDF